jgi:hypothetical protein
MEALKTEASRLGISKSELIRRFFDERLDIKGTILDEEPKKVVTKKKAK